MEKIIHPFRPVSTPNSRVLILGSFPSVKSREDGFYYAHPQNRFWKIMEALFDTHLTTREEKIDFLEKEDIALWDSIGSCIITGSADSEIKDAMPNDIKGLIEKTRIKYIYTNGTKSHEIYRHFILPKTGIEDVKLPSTSPANAAWSLERLINSWRVVKDVLSEDNPMN